MAEQISIIQVSGKIGNIVGMKGNGKNYAREKKTPKNPRTQKQTAQRMKVAIIGKLMGKLKGFVNETCKGGRLTAFANAIKMNLDEAIGGTYPNYETRYDQLRVSMGSLENPYNPTAAVEAGLLTVSWTNNGGIGNAHDDDMACVLVYNSAKQQSVTNMAAGKRSEREGQLSVPSAWNGDNVEVYLCFHAAEANTQCTGYSESLYLGSLSV
jgi:hypothetical protein